MRSHFRKYMALLLTVILVLSLSACSGSTKNEDKIILGYIFGSL